MSIELMKRTIVETCRENLCLTLIFLQNKDLNQSVHQDVVTIFCQGHASGRESVSRDSNASIGIKGNARQFMC